jgi:hypothetical protein
MLMRDVDPFYFFVFVVWFWYQDYPDLTKKGWKRLYTVGVNSLLDI